MANLARSPFPGCDPYLQAFWSGFHTYMIVAMGDAMRGRLPAGLRARIEERVLLEEAYVQPDAMIVEYASDAPPVYTTGVGLAERRLEGGALVAEPVKVRMAPGETTQRSIQIVDVHNANKVITTLELLSPSNKTPGAGFNSFRRKQDALRSGKVSLVEIDLIRGGQYALTIPRLYAEPSVTTPYRVAILPAWEAMDAFFYAITLQQRLPVVDVPLRQEDAPLRLDLQDLHDIAYQHGDFGSDIEYGKEPAPPLGAKDAEWANELLRRQGFR